MKNKLYKLVVSVGASFKNTNECNKIRARVYEYNIRSKKNKYIEIEVSAESTKRIAYEKLNLITPDKITNSISHIQYVVWLESKDEEVMSDNINEIKLRIKNDIDKFKSKLERLENNFNNGIDFNIEVVNNRY